MKKRGFTLIELLGVIVVLAIIALITVPMIVTVLKGARRSAFKASAESVLKTAKMYYSKNISDNGIEVVINNKQVTSLQYINSNANNEDLPSFQFKGQLPNSGNIKIDNEGNVEFYLENGEFCATKSRENNTIYILEGTACNLDIKVPVISGIVTPKDKDKLVVVSSCYYEDNNHNKTGDAKVSSYGFKLDNGSWKTTTDNYYVFSGLKSKSTHTVMVSCTNELGIKVEKNLGSKTVGDMDLTSITIDKTGWAQSKTVTITFPAGRYKYEYSLDNGVTWTSEGITNRTWTHTYSSESDNGKLVMARVSDNSGNFKEGKTLKIAGIDRTAPTCGTITGAGTSSTWTKNNRTVSVGCSDNGECYQATFSKTFSDNSRTTGTIQIKDKANNTADCTVGVYIDKLPPTCGTITGAATYTNNKWNWAKTRTVSVGCSDTGGSNCQTSTFSNTFSSTLTTGTVQIKDNANNAANCSVNVYVDTAAPTCTTSGVRTSGNVPLTTWSTDNVKLTGTCTDTGGSGCQNATKTVKASDVEVAKVSYEAHEQDLGWMGYVANGDVGGITGHTKRLEAIRIKVSIPGYSTCGVQYLTHIAGYGWDSAWKANGTDSGTTGESKSLEAIQIQLTGDCASKFNVKYRAHVADVGWQSWVSNGATAGTTGQSKNMEAIQIYLEPKSDSGYQLVNYTPVRKISPGTVTDGAGNTANCPVAIAAVDDTDGPTITGPDNNHTLTNTSGGALTCGEVGVGATALDSKSGVQKYQKSADNATWIDVFTLGNPSTDNPMNEPHTAKQNHTLYYRACDYSGKCGASASTYVHIGEYSPASSSCSVANCGSSTRCLKTKKVTKTAGFKYALYSPSGGTAYPRVYYGGAWVSNENYCKNAYVGGSLGSCNYNAQTCLCNYQVEESYWGTCYQNSSCESCETQEASCHD